MKEALVKDHLQTLWGTMPDEPLPAFDLTKLDHEARRFARTIFWRDFRELFFAAPMLPFFVWKAFSARNALELSGDIACVLSTLWVCVALYLLRPKGMPASTSPVDERIAWYRAALLSQARLLRRVWVSYLNFHAGRELAKTADSL